MFLFCIMYRFHFVVAFSGQNGEKYFYSVFLGAYSILHFNLICSYIQSGKRDFISCQRNFKHYREQVGKHRGEGWAWDKGPKRACLLCL